MGKRISVYCIRQSFLGTIELPLCEVESNGTKSRHTHTVSDGRPRRTRLLQSRWRLHLGDTDHWKTRERSTSWWLHPLHRTTRCHSRRRASVSPQRVLGLTSSVFCPERLDLDIECELESPIPLSRVVLPTNLLANRALIVQKDTAYLWVTY